MLERFSHTLHLGVARDTLTLMRRKRWGGATELIAELALAPGTLDTPGLFTPALRGLLGAGAWRGHALTVVLADELVRLWRVTPPLHASRLADLEAAAMLRYQSLYGESCDLSNVCADWDVRAPFWAAAAAPALLPALLEVAREERLCLREITPQFIKAWNRWRAALPAQAWFALVHGELLTVGVVDGADLLAVRSAPIAPRATLAWLQGQVEREALYLNLAAPVRVAACGDLPQRWLDGAGAAGFACGQLERARATPALTGGAALAVTGAYA